MSMQRLHIVVPYRDRASHLDAFVPHVRAYFARDKLDRIIPYRVTIVEQEPGLPFNRGALLNVGFVIGEKQSDYTCLHDIDYLPIWADYSPVERPTAILWYGAETRPIAPGRSNAVITNDLESTYSGVLLVPNVTFRQVNGYSNDYWGWGYEDFDLLTRLRAAKIEPSRRKGTFRPLDHDNAGFIPDGRPAPIAGVNRRLFQNNWADGTAAAAAADGLSNLSYEILDRREIPDPSPERSARWEIVTVRLTGRPRPEQLQALA